MLSLVDSFTVYQPKCYSVITRLGISSVPPKHAWVLAPFTYLGAPTYPASSKFDRLWFAKDVESRQDTENGSTIPLLPSSPFSTDSFIPPPSLHTLFALYHPISLTSRNVRNSIINTVQKEEGEKPS